MKIFKGMLSMFTVLAMFVCTMPSVKVKIIDKNEEGIGELIAKAPNIMLILVTRVSKTNSSLPKKRAIRGEQRKIIVYNTRLKPRLTMNAVL